MYVDKHMFTHQAYNNYVYINTCTCTVDICIATDTKLISNTCVIAK